MLSKYVSFERIYYKEIWINFERAKLFKQLRLTSRIIGMPILEKHLRIHLLKLSVQLEYHHMEPNILQ